MKVTITDDEILVETFDHVGQAKIDWSCRIASHESCAWAIKRLGEELQKSIHFYHSGEPVDQIVVD
jgi:hypothetical protein